MLTPLFLSNQKDTCVLTVTTSRSYAILILILLSIGTFAQPRYEFRAAWVATVDNIDWPSRGNYNSEVQKKEFIDLLEMNRRNGLNAVIVQVRPASDAFFPSPLEPWSEWLTGKQGRPPVPYYDPLQFMIAETHKRGMEFHAWCNPYRAEFSIGRSSIAPTHVTRIHPEWFLAYGGKRYFDPGNKEAQQHVTRVIRDLVRRYDVDAIHFDDYFYPYRIAGQEFPDASSYNKYGKGKDRNDWRRANVDSIILSLSRAIKEENRDCKFGVSPFGVWRNSDKDPEGSVTKAGQTNYDDLYADILLWLRNGWIDYVLPQLYWEFNHRLVGYEILTDWWSKHTYGKHLYIGHGIYKAYEPNAPRWKNPEELPDQIKKLREYPEIQGSAYYSSKILGRNPNGWSDSLRNNYYHYWAIIPPMPWLDTTRPSKPQIKQQADNGWLVSSLGPAVPRYFILYNVPADSTGFMKPENIIGVIGAKNGKAVYYLPMHPEPGVGHIAVSAISKNNIESEAEMLLK